MAGEQTMTLLNKLIERSIERGEEVTHCLTLLREFSEREEKNALRNERAAEREAQSKERDRELRERELALQEKELQMKINMPKDVMSQPDTCRIKAKLPKYVEGEDIEVFLTTFERLASVHKWPKSQWAVHLIPQLSGKALEAYSRMSVVESTNYESIKKAILDRYGLNSWEYREKFRNCRQAIGESFKEYSVRLTSYFDHWTEAESVDEDYAKLYDLLLREQLLFSSNHYLQVWLKEHQPTSVSELVNLAEAYQLAHKDLNNTGKRFQKKYSQNKGAKGSADENTDESGRSFDTNQKQEKRLKCFVCDSTEHLIASCPYKVRTDTNQVENSTKLSNNLLCSPTKQRANTKVVDIPVSIDIENGQFQIVNGLKISKGLVNNRPASVLRDTGCSAIFVSEKFLENGNSSKFGKKKAVTLADGSTKYCQEVRVEIHTPYISGVVDALVMSNPFADLVIGNIGNTYPSHVQKQSFQAMTRSMTEKGKSEELAEMKADELWKSDEYETKIDPIPTEGGIDDILSSSDLINEQISDETLIKVRALSKLPAVFSKNAYFFERAGILYRAYKNADESLTEQIVVPKKYRNKLLSIAHDIPLSGHMGNKKTRNRLLQNFFWPGIFKDVAAYCRSCPECQRSVAKGKIKRSPLIPIPPMDEPFARIALDIVGPLNRTKRGNRFILTLCDYATKYPDAIPLKHIDTESVAEALMSIFSRLEIPKEILTDQGSNFMSALMKKLCGLLNIQKLHCTPYHPEANGLVERFNGTLKRMLTCFVHEKDSEWDVLLPYLLFAYREVPQETTGFSPFELLYGRHVRGPLSIIRESWKESPETTVSSESVLSYIIKTRDKLEKIGEMAKRSEVKAKKMQKLYYDRKSSRRHLKPGQLVCVLLPTVANKLLAQWKGPFEIIEQVSPVDYIVQVGKTKRNRKTFHINMLKEWFERPEVDGKDREGVTDVDLSNESKEQMEYTPLLLSSATDENDCDEDLAIIENPLLTPHEGLKDVKLNSELDKNQMEDLKSILGQFEDVLTDIPGRTLVLEHDVKLVTDIPVKKKAYNLPYALRDKVRKEIQDMIAAGIAEKSSSPYASPIVVVPKRDGSIRLCVDYRQLNQITIFDPQPMPKLDDIINKLVKARFMSKIDLTKGFWQIPLSESSREKSAFVTPFGHYQFLVMPFGMINSSASFVRLMKMVLSNCEEFADSFIDDIIIFSEYWNDHLRHIAEVLDALRQAHLTAKPSKCMFGFYQVEFLAHIVGNGEVRPTQEKIDAIQKIPPPKTKKQIRSFIGVVGFYRRFIPHFANISAVLTDLTTKGLPNKVRWLEIHQEAFDTLKRAMLSYPILQNPDFSCSFILQTDASDRGFGAVLLQMRQEQKYPIIFISKKLSAREKKYSTVEKECFAIVRSCQSLREYLIGKDFTIETDHFPLQWLHKMKSQNMRLLRWSLILQEYRFTVKHIP